LPSARLLCAKTENREDLFDHLVGANEQNRAVPGRAWSARAAREGPADRGAGRLCAGDGWPVACCPPLAARCRAFPAGLLVA
jgi:hypothetical protein